MKKRIIVLVFICAVSSLNAQNHSTAKKQIKKTILNYIENFFKNKFDAMNVSLHPRLAKRGLNPNGTMSTDYPPGELKKLMESKPALMLNDQDNKVKNISVFGNMASASLITGYPNLKWVEYIHLVKLKGEWKIINVFWEYYPKKE